MPDSTTQIKSPTARLHEWAEGNGFRRGTAAGDLVHEMVDAALAEAAAAERAAIVAELRVLREVSGIAAYDEAAAFIRSREAVRP